MSSFKVSLFYSYCHFDEKYRERMETTLSLLKKFSCLDTWSDRKIIAGQKWSEKIKLQIKSSNIVTFLVTPDFLNSEACIEEWNLVKNISPKNGTYIVPVIVRDCPWKDFDDMSSYQALPIDGKPISLWDDSDSAWKSVYDGLAKLIDEIRITFSPNQSILESISEIHFCSQTKEKVTLEDVFVFPQLYTNHKFDDQDLQVRNIGDLLHYKKSLIRGDLQSGKSKLLGHIFSDLANKSKPVIFADFGEIGNKLPKLKLYSKLYTEQFSGDFERWIKQPNKTILFDNLSDLPNCLAHIKFAEEYFQNIIITTSNDHYFSYFKEEVELSEYKAIAIEPLSYSKQEKLIKKWLRLSSNEESSNSKLEHERIDEIERNINSIIIHSRIVPRYPFFVLSILQTYELFMPSSIKITAYGHCYYALILAHLIKSGIQNTDENINACFNFASQLAFHIHLKKDQSLSITIEDYNSFIDEYQRNFLISSALLNRLCGPQGLLKQNNSGHICFNLPYSYYFFLGRHVANTYEENESELLNMIEHSYVQGNTLSLTFAIHHANDTKILEEIMLHTVCSVENVEPAKLDADETKIFDEILVSLPERILSDRNVDEERERERANIDNITEDDQEDIDFENDEIDHEMFKLSQNIEILSQILKNKSGLLEKHKVSEIIEVICDGGLRLVGCVLFGEDDIEDLKNYVEQRYESEVGFDKSIQKDKIIRGLSKIIRFSVFLWTMENLGRLVAAISKPELKDLVKEIRKNKKTPAFDVIYYFYLLNVGDSYGEQHKAELGQLVEKYDVKKMKFLHRIISLRTQHYFNTHIVKEPIKQSVRTLLNLPDK